MPRRRRRRVDWSQLPTDLLQLISSKLTYIFDYSRFRGVCTSWRSAASFHDMPPQIPWLLFPYHPDSDSRSFFNPSTNRLHLLRLPQARGRRICGSSHGWLVLVGTTPEIFLLNLITRAQIQLPPLTSFPRLGGAHSHFDLANFGMIAEQVRDRFIEKVILTSSPTSRDCVVFAAAVACTSRIAFCSPGNESWEFLEASFDSPIKDFICHQGRLIVIDHNQRVLIFDIRPCNSAQPTMVSLLKVQDNIDCYLVETSKELLLVCLQSHNVSTGISEDTLDVFKLDLRPQHKWSKVKCIAAITFFLSKTCSTSISSRDVPGHRANCIYLLSHQFDRPWTCSVHMLDMDGNVEWLPYIWDEFEEAQSQISWIAPNLC